jgi:hypothetical protein
MSLATAQSLAWNLAKTLMTQVMLIETDDGYSVMPTADFDGDPSRIVQEYDPFPV